MASQQTKPLSQRSPAYKVAKPFVLGGISACMATVCIQPIDMVKVRIQLMGEGGTGKVNRNPFSVGAQIIKDTGFFSLYKGLSAGILRQLTYGTTRLGIFRTLTENFKEPDNKPLSFQKNLIFSIVAGGTGALVGTPADAALVRMQADTILPPDQRRGYKNAGDALVKMYRGEGLKGFFAGAAPTVYRGLSVNIGMLTTYDPLKEWIKPRVNNDVWTTNILAALGSGWCASTVSLPFDFIKTRLQKQRKGPNGELPYKSFFDCVTKVARAEGPMAFYNGYFTYVVRISPHISLTWIFMEMLKGVKALE